MINNINEIDKNPFYGLKIAKDTELYKIKGRYPCPLCSKSRKFFCYTCYTPIEPLRGKLPQIKLPIKIDIIKHANEIDGKSTSAHAVVLASDDVSIYSYPNIPDYSVEEAVLIFPCQKSISVEQLVQANNYNAIFQRLIESHTDSPEQYPKGFKLSTLIRQYPSSATSLSSHSMQKIENLPFKKVIFIDSTWNQCNSIYKDPKISRLPSVYLNKRISQFWRHQKNSPRWYLATVEAIHQFLVEFHIYKWGLHPDYKGIYSFSVCTDILEKYQVNNAYSYCGQYDDLLFFFRHMYYLIHEYYDHNTLKAYKRPFK